MKEIEVDFKFLMRKLLGSRTEENYENDSEMSKQNCSSTKEYSTDSALLEKRSTLDLAKRADK